MVIGAQWPIKLMKDALVVGEMGPRYKATLQCLSILICLPFTLLYGYLVGRLRRELVLYIIIGALTLLGGGFYGLLCLQKSGAMPFHINYLVTAFYIYSSIFYALTVPTFWAFVNDINNADEAKRGYGLVVFGCQLGGLSTTAFARYYAANHHFVSLISTLMLAGYGLAIWLVMNEIRGKDLHGYAPTPGRKFPEAQPKVSFLQGLSLLASSPYVFGLLFMTFAQEVMNAMLQYNFYVAARTLTDSNLGVAIQIYDYGLIVQVVATLLSLTGVSYFQRHFGVAFCIVGYPTLLLCGLIVWKLVPTLWVAMLIPALARGLHYALNKPVREILYVPTSKEVKYKSKAWIEVFGSQIFKASGNAIIASSEYLTGSIFCILPVAWIIVARLVGKKYDESVQNNVLVV